MNTLLTLAENTTSPTGKKVQNVLSFHYGFDYFREAILPLPPPQSIAIPTPEIKEIDTNVGLQWNAYPNPATNEVIIEYALPENAENPVLLISDSDGHLVLQTYLDMQLDQYLWRSVNAPNGLYYYTLKYNGQIKHTKQLLLLK